MTASFSALASWSATGRSTSTSIELCNYMQPSYRDGDPEMVTGTIVFSRVSRIESRPSLEGLEWGEDRVDGEILTVKPLLESDGYERTP